MMMMMNLYVHTDLVQQGLVSSSKPTPAILANDVVGPLLLEVSFVLLLLLLLLFELHFHISSFLYTRPDL